jgi:hypothetical protein
MCHDFTLTKGRRRMGERISDADYIAINDLMARYCWHVDDNEADKWVALWTEDGTFTGLGPEPLVGREALKNIPRTSYANSGGKMRHMYGNMYCDYGETRDVIKARLVNFVTNWKDGGAFQVMALCNVTFVREADGWKVKRNEANILH